jgi:hypothetical protein
MGMGFRQRVRLGVAGFIGFVEVKPGLDIVAMCKAAGAFGCLELIGAAIAPAAFLEEIVPDFDFFEGRFAALGERPLQNFLISASLEDTVDESVVMDAEKACAPGVEPAPIAGPEVVIGRKFSGAAQSDFIEHAAEENDATDFFVVTAESGNFHEGRLK